MWENVSKEFAKGASDVVHVFQKAKALVWKAFGEILNTRNNKKPKVKEIIYHVIMPDGKLTYSTKFLDDMEVQKWA
jgi:hypothetical protein